MTLWLDSWNFWRSSLNYPSGTVPGSDSLAWPRIGLWTQLCLPACPAPWHLENSEACTLCCVIMIGCYKVYCQFCHHFSIILILFSCVLLLLSSSLIFLPNPTKILNYQRDAFQKRWIQAAWFVLSLFLSHSFFCQFCLPAWLSEPSTFISIHWICAYLPCLLETIVVRRMLPNMRAEKQCVSSSIDDFKLYMTCHDDTESICNPTKPVNYEFLFAVIHSQLYCKRPPLHQNKIAQNAIHFVLKANIWGDHVRC